MAHTRDGKEEAVAEKSSETKITPDSENHLITTNQPVSREDLNETLTFIKDQLKVESDYLALVIQAIREIAHHRFWEDKGVGTLTNTAPNTISEIRKLLNPTVHDLYTLANRALPTPPAASGNTSTQGMWGIWNSCQQFVSQTMTNVIHATRHEETTQFYELIRDYCQPNSVIESQQIAYREALSALLVKIDGRFKKIKTLPRHNEYLTTCTYHILAQELNQRVEQQNLHYGEFIELVSQFCEKQKIDNPLVVCEEASSSPAASFV